MITIKRTGLPNPEFYPMNNSGFYTAITTGLITRLPNFVRAFAQAAYIGSANGQHPIALINALDNKSPKLLWSQDVETLINACAPEQKPRVYRITSARKKWPKCMRARFWIIPPQHGKTNRRFSWYGMFRVPEEFELNDLTGIPVQSIVHLDVNNRLQTVSLTVTGRNKNSVARRMAAALGEDNVPFSYEVAKGIKECPASFEWERK